MSWWEGWEPMWLPSLPYVSQPASMGGSLYLRIGTRTGRYLIVGECVCGALWWWRIRIPAHFTSKMRVSPDSLLEVLHSEPACTKASSL